MKTASILFFIIAIPLIVGGIDGIIKREFEIKDISRTPLIAKGNFAIIAGLGNIIFGISSILVGFSLFFPGNYSGCFESATGMKG